MIKVLIADDHPVVREGIKRMLEPNRNIEVVSETATAQATLFKAQEERLDVILLDLSMPGSDGFDLLGKLRKIKPNTPILVLSMHSEEECGLRCLQLGAAGYLEKTSAPERLLQAILKVAAGRTYVSEELAERLAGLASGRHTAHAPPHLSLATREYQVMRALADGKTARAIAAELGISPNTVNSYWNRIKTKLMVRNRTELVRYAYLNLSSGLS